MSIVTVRHTRPTRGGDEEFTEVHGIITHARRNADLPAGSFNLRGLAGFQIGQAYTASRGLIGSVSSPRTYNNSVNLISQITGTTGTRAVTGPGAIGSVPAAGSVIAPFIAWGF